MRIPEYRVWITAPKEGWLGVDDYDTFDWDNRMRMVSSIHFPLGSYSGKDITAEAISEPDYYADGWLGANYSDQNTIESFDYILMEYTGLKDKNGVKIFEGDILETSDDSICYVVFEDTGFAVKTHGSEAIDWEFSNFYSECEIIGNIHQNPELL